MKSKLGAIDYSVLVPAAQAFKFPKYRRASEVLQQAREILRHEERWITGDLAKAQEPIYAEDPQSGEITKDLVGVDSVECDTDSKEAVAFCALGAVNFVNGPAERSATAFLRQAAHRLSNPRELPQSAPSIDEFHDDDDIFMVNDDGGSKRNHKRVLRMFSMAIASAKKAEKKKQKGVRK